MLRDKLLKDLRTGGAGNTPKSDFKVDLKSARIAVRRLSRMRGTDAFGNGRDVELLVARTMRRQDERISRERDSGKSPDVFTITRDDLLGPKATKARAR